MSFSDPAAVSQYAVNLVRQVPGVHALHRMDLRRDVSLDALIALANDVSRFFAREMPGTVYRTGPIPEPAAV